MHLKHLAALALPLVLTGCSLSPTAPHVPEVLKGTPLQGHVHGGRQAVNGARVYLMAATSGGTGLASTSLLNSTATGFSDSTGAYVPTFPSGGYFNISGDYTCTAGQVVYLLALGGDSGAGTNSNIGLMAVLGTCPAAGNFATTVPSIEINEVSTVVAAYSIAGFALDATHVSYSGSASSVTGVTNAFATAANMANIVTGVAYTATANGTGTVPQTLIYSIANILASCVNASNTAPGQCTSLFAAAKSAGSTGATPTETATAAINIAHNPISNLTTLYNLQASPQVYTPALTAVPTDFILALKFTGGGLNTPEGVAIDGSGNVWMPNFGPPGTSTGTSISRFTPLGVGTSFSGGGLTKARAVAIDPNNNIWVSNQTTKILSEFNNSGTPVSSTGYDGTANGINVPRSLTVDGNGNVWLANASGNTVSAFNNSGGAIGNFSNSFGGPNGINVDASNNIWVASGSSNLLHKLANSGSAAGGPFSGNNLSQPGGVAIDASGNAWVTSGGNGSVNKFTNAGVAAGNFINDINDIPNDPHVDGGGNVWMIDDGNSVVLALTNTGAFLSPTAGFKGVTGYPTGSFINTSGIAVDQSGNVWIANGSSNFLMEFVGAAVPTTMPLSQSAHLGKLGARP